VLGEKEFPGAHREGTLDQETLVNAHLDEDLAEMHASAGSIAPGDRIDLST
jgi:hypothetical protein